MTFFILFWYEGGGALRDGIKDRGCLVRGLTEVLLTRNRKKSRKTISGDQGSTNFTSTYNEESALYTADGINDAVYCFICMKTFL